MPTSDMVFSLTLNPAVDNAWFVDRLRPNDANRAVRVDRDAGGKGINLSRVVAELGGYTVASGFLGGTTGDFIRHVLTEQGVEQHFVETVDDTRVNFSVEDETKAPPTTFNAPGPKILAAEWAELLEIVRTDSSRAGWVAIAGSLPRGVETDAYAVLGSIAKERGAKVMVDADGEVLAKALNCRPDFIKPNEKEASRLLGRTVETTEETVSAAREILGMLAPDGIVVVSRGAKGAVMAHRGDAWVGLSPNVEVKSTMGSGDSMIAGILWALEEGKSVEDAFRWGLACGAATAATDGTKIARRATVVELYEQARVDRV